jgi:DNA excision repair protein ERCC-5
VRLESLNRKKMAIDASIWIYQFLKAVRDSSGGSLRKSHIVGFFRRICKLLYFGILPVFVFDGGAPLLKRETVRKRKERRLGKREGAENTARRLLALQLQKKQNSSKQQQVGVDVEVSDNVQEEEYHYLEDLDKTKEQLDNEQRSKFKSSDEYHLPTIKGFEHTKDDTRIITEHDQNELKSIAEQVDELDGIDLNTIDPGSAEFSHLPLSTQYMVLSQLRLRSRLRMGYSKEQLENIFPDKKDFSKFQIEMVQKRNYFTQRLMNISGMDSNESEDKGDEIRRIAGERGSSYRIQKNEGGWSLSLDDKGSTITNAIDLEKEELRRKKERKPFEQQDDDDDEEDDVEWEDVSLEPTEKKRINYSISALPLPPASSVLGEYGIDSTVKSFSFSPVKSKSKRVKDVDDEEENEDQDEEAIRQIEEIELIEAIQRSKAELKKEQELEQQLVIQESIDSVPQKKSPVTSSMEQVHHNDAFFENSPFDLPDIQASSVQKSSKQDSSNTMPPPISFKPLNVQNMKLRSEMDHMLNLNPGIVNGKQFKKNVSVQEEDAASDHVKKPPQRPAEQPSWFDNALENPYRKDSVASNPPIITSVLRKPSMLFNSDAPSGTAASKELGGVEGEKSGEFVPFYEAREMVKNRNLENDIERAHADEEEEVVEVERPVVASNDEIVEVSDHEEVKEVQEDDETGDNVAERGKDEGQEGSSSSEPAEVNEPIDYEFYESDEERLHDQLNKEEQEHEQFQKDLNPHILETLSIDAIDKSESLLREQQKKELRDSDEVTQEMVKEVQELLACFGIPYITAPMEAEAQCAELLNLGLVDGIVTDDSDVFLFGGDKVYKNMFHEKNYVEFYNGRDIERELGLDRLKFIALAHLLGSDYTEGLKGIGPVSSMEILAHFTTLENFKDWFEKGQFDIGIQSKEDTFERTLRKKLVKNEIILEKGFPDGRINQAYLQPEVDHDKSAFVWGAPDLDKLRTYLMASVGWGQDKVDQVLVPLIKDLNKKKREGMQSTLNQFYSVDDVSYYQKKNKRKTNKRLTDAREKMKRRRTANEGSSG